MENRAMVEKCIMYTYIQLFEELEQFKSFTFSLLSRIFLKQIGSISDFKYYCFYICNIPNQSINQSINQSVKNNSGVIHKKEKVKLPRNNGKNRPISR